MPDTNKSLDALGIQHGTDKASTHHNYLIFYDRFLSAMRENPIRLLEVGVNRGQSVRMWAEYFAKGNIIGVDIDPECLKYESGNIAIEVADQSNIGHLHEIATRYGPFDIVVDDGSHLWNHQITTLHCLYPSLRPGGYYILEDIDTSFGKFAAEYQGNATQSAFEYLEKLNRYIVAESQLDLSSEEDSFVRTFAPATEFIAFSRRTALMHRHSHVALAHVWPASTAVPSAYPLLNDPHDLSVSLGWLTVHLGNTGDVINRGLFGGIRGDRAHTIQGFVALLKADQPNDLEYKALFSSGTWSDWASSGTFVGSRGAGVALKGFAARLKGRMRELYDCKVAGAFVDNDDIVLADAEAECAAPTLSDLEALQILIFRRRGV